MEKTEEVTATTSEEVKQDEYRQVVLALLKYTSVPFLELVAVTPLSENRVEQIVEDLERNRWVTVHGKEDPTRKIVTVAPRQYDHLLHQFGLVGRQRTAK